MTIQQEIRNKIIEFQPTSQEVSLFDRNLNDNSVWLFKFKNNNNNKFKIWIFTDRLKLKTSLTTSLLFSINIPDKVCLAFNLIDEINGIGKIYTDNSKDDKIHACIKLLRDNLQSLNFDDTEGLTVYGNELELTLNIGRKLLPEIEMAEKIKHIIELHFPEENNDVDYSDLPSDIRKILENLKHALSRTTLKEKRRLKN